MGLIERWVNRLQGAEMPSETVPGAERRLIDPERIARVLQQLVDVEVIAFGLDDFRGEQVALFGGKVVRTLAGVAFVRIFAGERIQPLLADGAVKEGVGRAP